MLYIQHKEFIINDSITLDLISTATTIIEYCKIAYASNLFIWPKFMTPYQNFVIPLIVQWITRSRKRIQLVQTRELMWCFNTLFQCLFFPNGVVDYKITQKNFNFSKKHDLPFFFVSAADGANVVKVIQIGLGRKVCASCQFAWKIVTYIRNDFCDTSNKYLPVW